MPGYKPISVFLISVGLLVGANDAYHNLRINELNNEKAVIARQMDKIYRAGGSLTQIPGIFDDWVEADRRVTPEIADHRARCIVYPRLFPQKKAEKSDGIPGHGLDIET